MDIILETNMIPFSGAQNHPPYLFPQLPPLHPSLIPTHSVAAPKPPHPLQGPPMAFFPQQPVLCSPPPTPPLGPNPPLGPPMQLTRALDVIKEEEYKVVVGREGTTLNGIRSCSQVNVQRHFQTIVINQRASIIYYIIHHHMFKQLPTNRQPS